jgi:hypothetical protein
VKDLDERLSETTTAVEQVIARGRTGERDWDELSYLALKLTNYARVATHRLRENQKR